MKAPFGLSPIEALVFLNELYTGHIRDKELTKCHWLFRHWWWVMADRGFDIQDDFAAKGVIVNIPSFLKGKAQFSKEEI